MRDPWAADVNCDTNDNSNTGKVQIVMVAHTSGGDYYSWGNESCGEPVAPSYGHEFFRKASVSVTLSIKPLTSNLFDWYALLMQL
jgi:hypothetical protein